MYKSAYVDRPPGLLICAIGMYQMIRWYIIPSSLGLIKATSFREKYTQADVVTFDLLTYSHIYSKDYITLNTVHIYLNDCMYTHTNSALE